MGCAASTSETSNGAPSSAEAESSRTDQQQPEQQQLGAKQAPQSDSSSSGASPSTSSVTNAHGPAGNVADDSTAASSSGAGSRRRSSAAFGSGSARSRRESNGMAMIPVQDASEEEELDDADGDGPDGGSGGSLGSPASALGGGGRGGGHTSPRGPRRNSSHPFAAADDEGRLLSDDPDSMNHYHQATFGIPDDDPYYAAPAAVRVVHRHSTSNTSHSGSAATNAHRPESPVASSLKGSVSGKASPACDALSESTMSESRKRVAFRVHSVDGPLSPGAPSGRSRDGDHDATNDDDLAVLLTPKADADNTNTRSWERAPKADADNTNTASNQT